MGLFQVKLGLVRPKLDWVRSGLGKIDLDQVKLGYVGIMSSWTHVELGPDSVELTSYWIDLKPILNQVKPCPNFAMSSWVKMGWTQVW